MTDIDRPTVAAIWHSAIGCYTHGETGEQDDERAIDDILISLQGVATIRIHALKADVAELVEALRKASDFVPFDKIGRQIKASFHELISKHGGAL